MTLQTRWCWWHRGGGSIFISGVTKWHGKFVSLAIVIQRHTQHPEDLGRVYRKFDLQLLYLGFCLLGMFSSCAERSF